MFDIPITSKSFQKITREIKPEMKYNSRRSFVTSIFTSLSTKF